MRMPSARSWMLCSGNPRSWRTSSAHKRRARNCVVRLQWCALALRRLGRPVILRGDGLCRYHAGRAGAKRYGSGATTRHISPNQSDFTSYTPLSPPVFLNAANQQHFPAVGTGTLAIRVPNKGTKSKLALCNTLHTSSIAYTLVSLGALDSEGYHFRLGDGRLETISPEGERVGQIPRKQ